jgi:hypothetical protein
MIEGLRDRGNEGQNSQFLLFHWQKYEKEKNFRQSICKNWEFRQLDGFGNGTVYSKLKTF